MSGLLPQLVSCLVVYQLIILIPPSLQLTSSAETFSLNGDDWIAMNGNASYRLRARVPGTIYTDLMRASILGDPYYRMRDIEYRWVSYENWTYSKLFDVPTEILTDFGVVELRCEGIDTAATIRMNNQEIGIVDNMFRRYVFNVKDVLRSLANEIQVSFISPPTLAMSRANDYPYPMPQICPPKAQHGDCQPNFLRKMASSFSWDWGPSFPTMGIWKDIKLYAYNVATIDYLTVETVPDSSSSGAWTVRGSVHFESDIKKRLVSGQLCLRIQGVIGDTCQAISWAGRHHRHRYLLEVPATSKVLTWWPNGHGEQPLYTLIVTFASSGPGPVLFTAEAQTTFGFRTVELMQHPIEGASEGLSFYFRINGVSMFMKGSNWVPADAFQERITDDYLKRLLYSVAESNMNMLRVWGGGVYESDLFYDLANQLGILLWQDFMFACSLYPTNGDFIDNVRAEITHVVRRLQHNPAIAVWAGNNENEAALSEDWYGVKRDYNRYYDDYVTLYIDTVRDVVMLEDDSRPFLSSSPSNGGETIQEGWVAADPQNVYYGDIHHYDYTSDTWNWEVFPIPRFASEYGLESWCSFETLRNVSEPGDWDLMSDFSDSRQHHPNGNQLMLNELSAHLKPPRSSNNTKKFQDFIYLTQISQAVGIKTETELYRRMQSSLVNGSQGMTMGALYWQINDIWQAPTWASIEYGGRWKILQYYAKRFFNNTLLSPYISGNKVYVDYIEDIVGSSVEVKSADTSTVDSSLKYYSHRNDPKGKTNDVLESKEKRPETSFSRTKGVPASPNYVTLFITAFTWDSLTPKQVWPQPFAVPQPKSTSRVFEGDLSAMLSSAGCQSRDHCLLTVSLDMNPTIYPNNYLLLSNFTTVVGLQKARLLMQNLRLTNSFTVGMTLTTDNIAAFVWLEVVDGEGWFSDNGFILVKNSVELVYHSWKTIHSVEEFSKSLSVKSLSDVET